MAGWQLPPESGHMERPDGVYYQTMNMTEIDARLKQNDLIIIPVGSTECHGAAQPLGEDTFLVTRMAEQVARETGCTVAEPVCMALIPTITWYAWHRCHSRRRFPGLPSCIIAGFWNAGFRKQILLNGHGQEEVIPLALHQFAKKYQVPASSSRCTGPP